MPSGKIYRIQGYENIAIDELLKYYKEDDLIISNLHKIEGECFRILFLLVLRKELDCINELCTKKGVKI